MTPLDALQLLDKLATLPMYKVDELVLLPAQNQDALPAPPLKRERRRCRVEPVERREEGLREVGRGEGDGSSGSGEVLRAVREEGVRRGRADDGHAERDARVCVGGGAR